MNLLQALNNDGHTIAIVTHNPENLKYTSRCINLRDGKELSPVM